MSKIIKEGLFKATYKSLGKKYSFQVSLIYLGLILELYNIFVLFVSFKPLLSPQ